MEKGDFICFISSILHYYYTYYKVRVYYKNFTSYVTKCITLININNNKSIAKALMQNAYCKYSSTEMYNLSPLFYRGKTTGKS